MMRRAVPTGLIAAALFSGLAVSQSSAQEPSPSAGSPSAAATPPPVGPDLSSFQAGSSASTSSKKKSTTSRTSQPASTPKPKATSTPARKKPSKSNSSGKKKSTGSDTSANREESTSDGPSPVADTSVDTGNACVDRSAQAILIARNAISALETKSPALKRKEAIARLRAITEAKKRCAAKKKAKTKKKKAKKDESIDLKQSSKVRNADGTPTDDNPAFSLALPGAAPIGVPNFFIEKFRIPPFLLPIYQAAGIQYGVRWEVLAAINEIETDYGRNLNVSSAGALGWMQFMPATWEMYGVDGNRDDVKDPYNPVDAIFSAARYLRAAGAETDLEKAIFAYNHADWYVDSVIMRARLIGGLPSNLVGSLTGLTQAHFPVHAKARYADDLSEAEARKKVKQGQNAANLVQASQARRGIRIFAKAGSPAIAANDGRITKIGVHPRLGRYVQLQDVYGNTFTYGHLKTLAERYPVPRQQKLTRKQMKEQLAEPAKDAKPTGQASAGDNGTPVPPVAEDLTAAEKALGTKITGGLPIDPAKLKRQSLPSGKVSRKSDPAARATADAADDHAGHAHAAPDHAGEDSDSPARAANPDRPGNTAATPSKRRLFANPTRPAAQAAGADRQLSGTKYNPSDALVSFDGEKLDPKDFVWKKLKVGSRVSAGTVLGRLGVIRKDQAPHLLFEIRPAGRGAPRIDPKPILDGWKLLESTEIYRAAGKNPFYGSDAKTPSIGQILLMSKQTLQERVLANPRIDIYECGRKDVEAGIVDRRVLATLEFLAASGLKPTVTSFRCGHGYYTASGNVSHHSSGNAVDISAINGIPILGNQGPGSITEVAVQRLLTLQGAMKPSQIITLMTFDGADNTYAMGDHADHIHIGWQPLFGTNSKLAKQVNAVLKPEQWNDLIEQLNSIANPKVSTKPSDEAIKVESSAATPSPTPLPTPAG